MDYGYIKKRARELRKSQTPAEDALWHLLRNRKFHGLKFLRQHAIQYEVSGRKFFSLLISIVLTKDLCWNWMEKYMTFSETVMQKETA